MHDCHDSYVQVLENQRSVVDAASDQEFEAGKGFCACSSVFLCVAFSTGLSCYAVSVYTVRSTVRAQIYRHPPLPNFPDSTD